MRFKRTNAVNRGLERTRAENRRIKDKGSNGTPCIRGYLSGVGRSHQLGDASSRKGCRMQIHCAAAVSASAMLRHELRGVEVSR
jgi:hypothetical protein